ncbi:MAG: hypothetical protein GY706_16390, partial [Bacteroides sp.]|nr:hypothetical protein [Bacteroides sp.]
MSEIRELYDSYGYVSAYTNVTSSAGYGDSSFARIRVFTESDAKVAINYIKKYGPVDKKYGDPVGRLAFFGVTKGAMMEDMYFAQHRDRTNFIAVRGRDVIGSISAWPTAEVTRVIGVSQDPITNER